VRYGNFLAGVLNFIFVAFALFLVVKAVNAAQKKEAAKPAPPPPPSAEVQLLTEIRDALKNRQ
jgi:large conductance mechanosensitive channel